MKPSTQQTELSTDLPDDVVLSVRGVSKKFCRNLKRSMAFGMKDLAMSLAGVRQGEQVLRRDEFWAVKDISFDLRRGECLGLIGVNGSGKSTLLRVLHGIFPPDRGEILVRGRVEALIALGAGFHGHLTGRENIYLKGSILGMTRKEIDASMEEIIDFAEIGEFIDAPAATYSSGMTVRLGFAIAVSTKPDLLFVDEVLAVGDMGFRLKCLNKMNEVLSRSAVIFVSHSMPYMARVSTEIMVLDKGLSAFQGRNVSEGIDLYLSKFEAGKRRVIGGADVKLLDIKLVSGEDVASMDGPPLVIDNGDPLTVLINVEAASHLGNLGLRLIFHDNEMRSIADTFSVPNGFVLKPDGRAKQLEIRIPALHFNRGLHSLTFIAVDSADFTARIRVDNAISFQVKSSYHSWSTWLMPAEWSQKV
jgi:lipopolysaccharide transport system ATP-binding protein